MQRCNKERLDQLLGPSFLLHLHPRHPQSSCSSSCSLTHTPSIITLESLWLCNPIYCQQHIKTKASRIITRIKLYTQEKDSTGEYYQLHPSILIPRADWSVQSSITQNRTNKFLCLFLKDKAHDFGELNSYYCAFISHQT